MPAKACCQLIVRHYECDSLGHVNHAVYAHYFEVGRLRAMAAAGLPFSEVMQQGYAVVASDLFIQYKVPAFADDVLEVQSYITRFRGARMTWQQELYRLPNRELLAIAEVNGAFTLADGRPVRIPPPMRALLEAVYVPEAAWPARKRGQIYFSQRSPRRACDDV
jgi:acyl-CoA thioester hydrolase